MKNMKRFVLWYVMAMVLAQLVSAFGVTTPFYDTNPLITSPGKVEEVALLLQNMDEKSDVKLKAQIVDGADIAEITDENKEYLVPMGEKNVKVNLRIKVPDTMKPGEQRSVKVSFTQVGVNKEGGMVRLGTGITTNVLLAIASPPAPAQTPSSSMLIAAAVVLALAAAGVISAAWKKAKRRR